MMEKNENSNSAIKRSSERWRTFFFARLMVALLIAGVLLGGIYFTRRSGSDPRVYTNDFNVYYHAGREVISGRDPYQDSLRPSTPYLYPPLLSELIIPLALLPLPVAAYLWYLVSVASILSAAWMAAWLGCRPIQTGHEASGGDRVGPYESNRLQIVIAACSILMLIRFVLDNFDFGQVNTIVAAL